MCGPDFVAQTAELISGDERRAWFKARTDEFRKQGATWMQVAVDDTDDPKVTLAEGWRLRPKEQPKPHFQMTRKAAPPLER